VGLAIESGDGVVSQVMQVRASGGDIALGTARISLSVAYVALYPLCWYRRVAYSALRAI